MTRRPRRECSSARVAISSRRASSPRRAPVQQASQRLDPGYGTSGTWRTASSGSAAAPASALGGVPRGGGHGRAGLNRVTAKAKATRRAADLEKKLERLAITVTTPADGLVVRRTARSSTRARGARLSLSIRAAPRRGDRARQEAFSVEAQTAGPGQVVTVEVPPLRTTPRRPQHLAARRARPGRHAAPLGPTAGGDGDGGAGTPPHPLLRGRRRRRRRRRGPARSSGSSPARGGTGPRTSTAGPRRSATPAA